MAACDSPLQRTQNQHGSTQQRKQRLTYAKIASLDTARHTAQTQRLPALAQQQKQPKWRLT